MSVDRGTVPKMTMMARCRLKAHAVPCPPHIILEDEGRTFLQNAGIYPEQQPRRPQYVFTPSNTISTQLTLTYKLISVSCVEIC